jgi:hypothetical protein
MSMRRVAQEATQLLDAAGDPQAEEKATST